MQNFQRKFNNGINAYFAFGQLFDSGNLTEEETVRLEKMKTAWDFYEGFHWEGVDDLDSPQVTFNYCKPFVNKYVSFELGKGFTIKMPPTDSELTNADLNEDGEVLPPEEISERKSKNVALDFLNDVWRTNNKGTFCIELGQTKSVSGEAWVKVEYEAQTDIDDIFDEFPKGRIRLTCMPTQYVYPTFDEKDKEKLTSLLIMYPVTKEEPEGLLRKRSHLVTVLYKEVWTKDKITIIEHGEEPKEMENPYGFIPFVQVKNYPLAGRTYGIGDLDDIIPLNVEYNVKKSDISEVIDYHSAPITCVFGARIGNLEKGANKVWGGLPKDARISNLELNGDLIAANNYTKDLKTSMCEVGGIPETVLGGAQAISNTSGVALQYINLPLIERTRVKRDLTADALEKVNKMIITLGIKYGLLVKPKDISNKDFLYNEVTFPDTLPKDELMELQKIQTEMLLGLECRHGAMERLNREDIRAKLSEIDREREAKPELFNTALQTLLYQAELQRQAMGGDASTGGNPNKQIEGIPVQPRNPRKINSGMTNGETPNELLRRELNGKNG